MTVTATEQRERTELDLQGMTCASCAARIERKLNKLDGVDATVNFATERASVAFDPECVTVDELCGAVEAAGYRRAAARGRARARSRRRRAQPPARRRGRR